MSQVGPEPDCNRAGCCCLSIAAESLLSGEQQPRTEQMTCLILCLVEHVILDVVGRGFIPDVCVCCQSVFTPKFNARRATLAILIEERIVAVPRELVSTAAHVSALVRTGVSSATLYLSSRVRPLAVVTLRTDEGLKLLPLRLSAEIPSSALIVRRCLRCAERPSARESHSWSATR